MTTLDPNPSNGVFDPSAVRHMVEAFAKAESHLDRLRSSAVAAIDRDRVARRIVSEVRAGETQPDLVWRAAVVKVLLETRAPRSKAACEPVARSAGGRRHRRQEQSVVPTDLPPAGPHATPRHTNEDATPGSGALPAEQPGDDVDPATG